MTTRNRIAPLVVALSAITLVSLASCNSGTSSSPNPSSSSGSQLVQLVAATPRALLSGLASDIKTAVDDHEDSVLADAGIFPDTMSLYFSGLNGTGQGTVSYGVSEDGRQLVESSLASIMAVHVDQTMDELDLQLDPGCDFVTFVEATYDGSGNQVIYVCSLDVTSTPTSISYTSFLDIWVDSDSSGRVRHDEHHSRITLPSNSYITTGAISFSDARGLLYDAESDKVYRIYDDDGDGWIDTASSTAVLDIAARQAADEMSPGIRYWEVGGSDPENFIIYPRKSSPNGQIVGRSLDYVRAEDSDGDDIVDLVTESTMLKPEFVFPLHDGADRILATYIVGSTVECTDGAGLVLGSALVATNNWSARTGNPVGSVEISLSRNLVVGEEIRLRDSASGLESPNALEVAEHALPQALTASVDSIAVAGMNGLVVTGTNFDVDTEFELRFVKTPEDVTAVALTVTAVSANSATLDVPDLTLHGLEAETTVVLVTKAPTISTSSLLGPPLTLE